MPISKNVYELRECIYTKPAYFRDDKGEMPKIDYKDSIKYQKITSYLYDRNWTEFIFFTKGSAINKTLLECEKDRFRKKELLQKALNNTENIGLESDVTFSNYQSRRTIKEDIKNGK